MINTLLLCFIHGFKGDEETFFQFPQDLKNFVQEKSPELNVHTAVYPKYETRGDLAACVEGFREWLQAQVTDLEQGAGTPTAILNPSVAVVLVGHSMGGFVATDTLFSILTHRPTIAEKKCMFPLVAGLLTFDTPFNGLARSLFAYGAFSQYQNVSAAWNILSTLSGGIGLSAASAVGSGAKSGAQAGTIATANSSWKRWQLLAARTGTVGAVVAGGVTAYMHREEIGKSVSKVNIPKINTSYFKRENIPSMPKSISSLPSKESLVQNLNLTNLGLSRESIGEGFAWMASHLKFVGALMKQEQLSTRLERLSSLSGVGRCNVFTSLGENGYWTGGYFVPRRTFCAVPIGVVGDENVVEGEGKETRWWKEAANTKADNEIAAHCSMFQPDRNSGYQSLLELAGETCVSWITRCEVSEVVDGFVPDKARLARSRSESQTLDDDGKVRGTEEILGKADPSSIIGNGVGGEEVEADEDKKQLRAILACQELPEAEDGGVSEIVLEQAVQVPLPTDDDISKEGSKVPLPSNEGVEENNS